MLEPQPFIQLGFHRIVKICNEFIDDDHSYQSRWEGFLWDDFISTRCSLNDFRSMIAESSSSHIPPFNLVKIHHWCQQCDPGDVARWQLLRCGNTIYHHNTFFIISWLRFCKPQPLQKFQNVQTFECQNAKKTIKRDYWLNDDPTL